MAILPKEQINRMLPALEPSRHDLALKERGLEGEKRSIQLSGGGGRWQELGGPEGARMLNFWESRSFEL